MAKETVSFRVPSDTLREFEEYRKEHGGDEPLSKADAGRRLLESGLEAEKGVVADGGATKSEVQSITEEEVERFAQRVEKNIGELERRRGRANATLSLGVLLGVAYLGLVASGLVTYPSPAHFSGIIPLVLLLVSAYQNWKLPSEG